MNYLSVCSGIEAATVAWHDLGFNPVGFSEIEKFPSKVLAHHYPNVTNYGDMTKFKEWNINESVNLLVGGTPCQSFSIAGLRKGLDDPRGNLMLTFLSMAEHFKAKWILWENVTGVLSSNGGSDFATLLQGLAQLGYGFSYRVFNSQYFGVPQRRRRVFVVGCLGDWKSTAKVLFEPDSLCRNYKKSIKIQKQYSREDAIAFKIRGGCSGGGKGYLGSENLAFTLSTHQDQHLFFENNIRRFTPVECERLQGFPDNYTNIPTATDSNRYKALGNSMAVPVMKWIGQRIQEVGND